MGKVWPPRALPHHKPAARRWASNLSALALVDVGTLDHFVAAGANVTRFAERGKPLGMISARNALGPEIQEFQGELLQREHVGEVMG